MAKNYAITIQETSIEDIKASVQNLITTLDYATIKLMVNYNSDTQQMVYSCLMNYWGDEPPVQPPFIRYIFEVAYGDSPESFTDSLQVLYDQDYIWEQAGGVVSAYNPNTSKVEYCMGILRPYENQ